MSLAFDEAAELDAAELELVAEDDALAGGLAAAAWAIAEPAVEPRGRRGVVPED